MPRPRCSLTPTGASPVSLKLLHTNFEEDVSERPGDEGTLCLAEVGPLVRDRTEGEQVKKQKVRVGGRYVGQQPPRKLSKTLLESLLLHEIRALDRMAHLRETEVTEKFWCCKTDSIQSHKCVPRREVDGWLVSDGLDASKVLQSRLVLRNITLQLMEGEADSVSGACTPDGMSPRADALPVRILPDLPLYLGSGSSAKHADVLRAHGISRVVNVSAVVPNYHEEMGSISYVKVPVYDAEDVDIIGALKDYGVMEFIRQGLEGGEGVLVHCCAGRSRSVACVCAYLISRYGWSVEQALDAVRRVRVVSPNAGFLAQLELFYLQEVVGRVQ